MKILWLSSLELSQERVIGSGTWVPGMLRLLNDQFTELQIVNVTKGKTRRPIRKTFENFSEWLIPHSNKMSSKTISEIAEIIRKEMPDIVHIWGTEDIWGLFPFKKLFPGIPTLIDIQGILSYVSEEYYGGLTPGELLRCWNIKEFIKPSSSLPAIRRLYTKNINREKQILASFDNIGVQSKWTEDVIKTFNSRAKIYKSGIALRQPFYDSPKWSPINDGEIRIFATAITSQPLKGVYTLFKAFNIVHQFYPQAKLILAGAKEDGIRQSGLTRLLKKYARKNGFNNSIIHKGLCSAGQLAELYRTSSIFVNPSNWESYSVVTAEAMYIGCPVVAAYSGAMPELGPDRVVLYFPKNDYRICAMEILNIIEHPEMAKEMSRKSIIIGSSRQNKVDIANNQMNIYNQLLNR